MRALTWHGKHDVRVETVDDPEILNPRDAIIRITSTAICGSDLHLYDGYIPTMQAGDILGHEFMGEVVDTGPRSTNRLVKQAEAAFAVMPADVSEFDHFTPAAWLIRNPKILDAKAGAVPNTLDRAQAIFDAYNKLNRHPTGTLGLASPMPLSGRYPRMRVAADSDGDPHSCQFGIAKGRLHADIGQDALRPDQHVGNLRAGDQAIGASITSWVTVKSTPISPCPSLPKR